MHGTRVVSADCVGEVFGVARVPVDGGDLVSEMEGRQLITADLDYLGQFGWEAGADFSEMDGYEMYIETIDFWK